MTLYIGGEIMKRVISCLLIFILLIVSAACSGKGNVYVLTIDGTKISKGEYMVYLFEQKRSFEERGGIDIWDADFDGVSAEEVAKQNAINSITLVKATVAQADSLKVELSTDDYSSIASESSELYKNMGQSMTESIGVSEEDIENIVREGYIQQKVYDLVTDGFEVNEDEFEQYFEDNYYNEISRYNNITVKQIYLPSDTEDSTANYDKIQEARAKIQNSNDFDAVQKQYTQSTKTDAFYLEDNMFDDAVEDALYQLPQGAVSDVMETGDGYYIFKIMSVEAADINSVREGLRAEYIREKKMEIYQAQNEQWQENMKITRNDDVYNAISIVDIS